MKHQYFIGIDPGMETGLAIWNSTLQKFRSIQSVNFWQAIWILEEWDTRLKVEEIELTLVIEDPNLTTHVWDRYGALGRSATKIAQNVGACKREASLILAWCEIKGIKTIAVNPSDRRDTKMKAEAFRNLTKCNIQTNEHGRDAALLVFGK